MKRKRMNTFLIKMLSANTHFEHKVNFEILV